MSSRKFWNDEKLVNLSRWYSMNEDFLKRKSYILVHGCVSTPKSVHRK
jgi:hypothetical protein